MRSVLLAGLAALFAACASGASATVTTFSSQASFQAALNESFTLVNLDAQPLVGFAAGYRVEDPGPAAGLGLLGFAARRRKS